MKVSIVVPVYYNQDNLRPLYNDIKLKLFNQSDIEWEIVLVNDGSKDNSFEVMKELAKEDSRVSIFSLSKNFGSHAAILCGLTQSNGDCAVVKAADLQEPTEIILDMIEEWREGNNVVLAVREKREDAKGDTFFANLYYWMVRNMALSNMPDGGFDVYLLDRKVINVLMLLDERNSALTGQILWSGFKTSNVYYTRLQREIGTSKWTFQKKIRLVADTLFSFSTLPISIVAFIGAVSSAGSLVWAIFVLIFKLLGMITISGWTTLFIFNLFSFGVIMLTLAILGGYLWRTFDATRNRPTYIIEERGRDDKIEKIGE